MLLQTIESTAASESAASEAELLARAAHNDEAAVRALIQRHNRRLYRLARAILRNDSEAEDAVQEAYVRAFTGLAGFRGESGLGTWLGRIVINAALGRLRGRRPTVELSALETSGPGQVIAFPLASAQSDPESTMAQREIRALLERAIDDLPDAFRTVFIARAVEDMSIEETAALLGLRPETVKTRLHRARRLLKQTLERQLGAGLGAAFPFGGRRCARIADAVIARLAAPPS